MLKMTMLTLGEDYSLVTRSVPAQHDSSDKLDDQLLLRLMRIQGATFIHPFSRSFGHSYSGVIMHVE